jgi:hypothetical protein
VLERKNQPVLEEQGHDVFTRKLGFQASLSSCPAEHDSSYAWNPELHRVPQGGLYARPGQAGGRAARAARATGALPDVLQGSPIRDGRRWYQPVVLVAYILDNYISILQTKFSDREGHEARRIGL